MRIIRHEIVVGKGEWIYLEPLGDIHIGHPACDVDKFLRRVEAIKRDRRRFWLGMGDYIDNIRPWRKGSLDKRFDETHMRSELAVWIDQKNRFLEIVKPIKRKCLGMLWGNHEWVSMEMSEFEDMFCKPLGVPFLGSRCFVLLDIYSKDRRHLWRVKIFAAHGDYGGQKKGGAINRLQDLSAMYEADIYLYGHTHSKGTEPDTRYTVDVVDGKVTIVEKPVIYALTGGFLNPVANGVESYFDKKVQPRRIRVGTITVGIDPWERKLHGFD